MTWIGVFEVDITEEHVRQYVSAKENDDKKTVAYLRGENIGKEYLLTRSYYVIGRDEAADIRIADNRYVAKEHAVLQKEGGRYYLIDMYSVNGTRINGERMEPNRKYLLEESVRIEIANEVFWFEIR